MINKPIATKAIQPLIPRTDINNDTTINFSELSCSRITNVKTPPSPCPSEPTIFQLKESMLQREQPKIFKYT